MSSDGIWFFIFIAFVAAAGFYIAYALAEKRRKELEALAEQLGLFFAPHADEVHDRYEGFTPFGAGSSRRSSNLLHGQRGEVLWQLFEYRYTTGSGKQRQTHSYGIAAATVPIWFRKLQIRPEGIFDKLAAFVGYDDINFESEQFSRRYHVSCDVRKFAYDVIHPQMIEYLLGCPAHAWQIAGNIILIHKSGSFSAYEAKRIIEMVEGFLERIPAYVREDSQLRASMG